MISIKSRIIWRILRRIILALLVAGGGGSAYAQGNDSAILAMPKMKWLGKQYATICDGLNGTCTPVKMPKQLGKIEAIYPGPIIKNARASWIARSKFENFVCAVMIRSTKVACALINSEAFVTEHATLRVFYTQKGRTRVAIAGSGTAAGSRELKFYERRFNENFENTKRVLQGEVDAVTYGGYTFSSAMSVCDETNPNEPPEYGCELHDGVWVCPGDPPGENCVLIPGPSWKCDSDPPPQDPDPTPDPVPDPYPGACS